MQPIQIRGELLHVDVRGELEAFEWHRATWRGDKLIAASPFRPDNTPSFFVRLEAQGEYSAGVWADSGSSGIENDKGGLVQLLAYLRRESWDETERYLLDKYGTHRQKAEKLSVARLKDKVVYKPMPIEKTVLVASSRYLSGRGISETVQLAAQCGKPLLLKTSGYTALPWHDVYGNIKNVKYRATTGKRFFYEKDAQPISELVFGANLYLQHKRDLIVCEAEIDALSWRTVGYAAVAIGGSSMNKRQADIIKRLPCSAIILAGDNDGAGLKFTQKAMRHLRGKPLKLIEYEGIDAKDANEILKKRGSEQLRQLADNATLHPLFPQCTLQPHAKAR